MKLLLSLFIASSMLVTAFGVKHELQNSAPIVYQDSPPARKIPVFVIIIPKQEFYSKLDSSRLIMYDFGIEKGGSAIRTSVLTMDSLWINLINHYGRIDTVKIQGR